MVMHRATIEWQQKMDSLNYYLADMNMPETLRVRAREYLRNQKDSCHKTSYNDSLMILSPEIRVEMSLRQSGQLFERVRTRHARAVLLSDF
jgi:hypothetical protein